MEENIDRPNKKTLLKRWGFWVIIAILLPALGFTANYYRQRDEVQKRQQVNQHEAVKEKEDKEKKVVENQDTKGMTLSDIAAIDSSLSACPSSIAGLLNHEIIPMADLNSMIPLGQTSPGSHTIPTDHMYFYHMGSKRIPVYAPGDITLVSMDDKITYRSSDGFKIHDDYSIEFALCRGLVIFINHFVDVSPKIKEAWEQSDQQCDKDHKYHFGTDETSYYQPCMSNFKLDLKSGELMGYADIFAGGTNKDIIFDLGAYNYNSPPHAFANPERYSESNLHSMCGFDLFAQGLKDQYYAKLGTGYSDSNRTVYHFIPKVGEPLCGTDMQDVPGTLAGNWFVSGSGSEGVSNPLYQLVLVHNVFNLNNGQLSLEGQEELGRYANVEFTPLHTGNINREWSEITPGETVYCYYRTVDTNQPANNEKYKYLIQLTDATHLRIEKKSGACTANETITNPFTYER
jgi:hypothetical protein